MRLLAGIAVALLFIITTSSAYIRLAQVRLACEGVADCHGTIAAERAAAVHTDDPATLVARALHRIAASTVGVVVLLLLFLGWSNARTDERVVMVMLLALTAFLAWLGVRTPSRLPAVALGNLLGGIAMFGLAGWLVAAGARRPALAAARTLRPWVWLALVLLGLQIAAGGMIAVRHAVFACPTFPGCAGTWGLAGIDLRTLDPLRESAAPGSAGDAGMAALQALHLVHRWMAVPVMLLIGWIGLRALRLGLRATGAGILLLIAAEVLLGAVQVGVAQPLVLAVTHNASAACLVPVLAAVLERSRST